MQLNELVIPIDVTRTESTQKPVDLLTLLGVALAAIALLRKQ